MCCCGAGQVYSKFARAGGGALLLELLEPYILNDKLTSLSAEVMKAFVAHYASQGRLNEVERCILHMDIMCLDFQQV